MDEIREAIDIGEMIKETVMMNSRILTDVFINELMNDKDNSESNKKIDLG